MAKKETRYTVGSEIETFNTVVSEPIAPSLQARELPGQSGVYLMKDKDDRIIYVGKAKDLRKRVTSYFLANRSAKTAALVRKIVTIEYIITGNEYEALVLRTTSSKIRSPLQHLPERRKILSGDSNHQ